MYGHIVLIFYKFDYTFCGVWLREDQLSSPSPVQWKSDTTLGESQENYTRSRIDWIMGDIHIGTLFWCMNAHIQQTDNT